MKRFFTEILVIASLLSPMSLSAGTVSQFFDFCGDGDFRELILTDKKYDGPDGFLWKFTGQKPSEPLIFTSKKQLPIVAYQSKENPKILFSEWDPRYGFGAFYSVDEQGSVSVFSVKELQKEDEFFLKKLKIPKTSGFCEFDLKAISFFKNCAVGLEQQGENINLCLFTNSNDGREKPDVLTFFSFPKNTTNIKSVIASKKEDFVGVVFQSRVEKSAGQNSTKKVFNDARFTEVLSEFFGENNIENNDEISVLWFKIDNDGREIFPINKFNN